MTASLLLAPLLGILLQAATLRFAWQRLVTTFAGDVELLAWTAE